MDSKLNLEDFRRYGRQMIVDGFGRPAQEKLKNSSVLVVGAGGLGCPALQYLCSAGVGRIGIADGDIVELSNLQRQVLHSEATIGISKAQSASQSLKRLHSRAQIDVIESAIHSSNAEQVLSAYDVILDCTDNAPTRYLLSDTAVRLRKPLVSGAAQRLEGQLCVYNMALKDSSDSASERGPCYRCIYPCPPAPEMAGSCEETGILGAVTGVIGSLQALECIKIIAGLHDGKPNLLLYSALTVPPFRSIKLRARSKACAACGDVGEGKQIGEISQQDYVAFCGGARPDWERRGLEDFEEGKRIRATELRDVLQRDGSAATVLDVRPPIEFGICHLPSSINIPLSEFLADPTACFLSNNVSASSDSSPRAVFVCRLGNDSQLAANALRSALSADDQRTPSVQAHEIVDLVGGLRSWSKDVDPDFPVY